MRTTRPPRTRWPNAPTGRMTLVQVTALISLTANALAGDESPWKDWTWAASDHFRVYGNVDHRALATVAGQLEGITQLQVAITQGTRVDSGRPTHIFVFKNQRSMEPYLGEFIEAKVRVGGLFLPREDANFAILDLSAVDDPTRLVYHEWTHYFTSENLHWLPSWLHEGLAEYFSSCRIERQRAEVGRTPEGLLDALQSYDWKPWPEVFAWTSSPSAIHSLDHEDVGALYAQSWALTHYLLRDAVQHPETWNSFLSLLRAGAGEEEALRAAYRLELDQLSPLIRKHVFSLREAFVVYDFAEEISRAVRAFGAPSDAEMYGRLGDLLAHLGSESGAAAEEYLLRSTALDSTRADTRTALGYLRLREHRRADAVEELRAAVRLAPDDARALALLGLALLLRFEETMNDWDVDFGTTHPMLLEARAALHRCLELAPERIEEKLWLAKTFLWKDGEVWEGLRAASEVYEEQPDREEALEVTLMLTANSGNRPGAWASLDRARASGMDTTRVGRVERHLIASEFRARLGQPGVENHPLNLLNELEGHTLTPASLARIAQLRAQVLEAEEAAASAAEVSPLPQPEPHPGQARPTPLKVAPPDVRAYNRAVQLARDGEIDQARRLFEEVLRQAKWPDLADSARVQIEQLRLFQRYEAAAEMASRGEIDPAIALLDSIRAAAPLHGLGQQVARALRELRAAKIYNAAHRK